MKDIAFWTDETCRDSETGTYAVNMSRKNDPGYYPHNDSWPSLEAAQAYADDMNASNGLTKDEVREIIASSRRAQREEEHKREMLDLTPDVDGLIRFAQKVQREADPDSKDAEVARKILTECGVDE